MDLPTLRFGITIIMILSLISTSWYLILPNIYISVLSAFSHTRNLLGATNFTYDARYHFVDKGFVYLRQNRLSKYSAIDFTKHKRIVLCASVRQAEATLNDSMKTLEKFGSYFRNYVVLIVENDSKDGTREMLLQWAARNKRVRILGCGINAWNCSLQHLFVRDIKPGNRNRVTFEDNRYATYKMSVIRNIYLRYALNDRVLQMFDYIGVYEMDNGALISWDAFPQFVSSLRAPYIDAVCALEVNAADTRQLRDACTLVVPPITLRQTYLPPNPQYHHYVSLTLHGARTDFLLKVQSCYQALALYRVAALRQLGAEYRPSPPGFLTCEHNELAYQLRNMYIDKRFILKIYRYAN